MLALKILSLAIAEINAELIDKNQFNRPYSELLTLTRHCL